jgi:hypothetical protein
MDDTTYHYYIVRVPNVQKVVGGVRQMTKTLVRRPTFDGKRITKKDLREAEKDANFVRHAEKLSTLKERFDRIFGNE